MECSQFSKHHLHRCGRGSRSARRATRGAAAIAALGLPEEPVKQCFGFGALGCVWFTHRP